MLYIKADGWAKWHIFLMQALLLCSYDAFKILPRGPSDPELPYFCKDRYVSYRNYMQGNKEHDPIIGERIGTLTSADRIYPMDDWVGWHLQIHDPVFQCIGISKLQETQMFKRGWETVPSPKNQPWPPYRRRETSKKPRN